MNDYKNETYYTYVKLVNFLNKKKSNIEQIITLEFNMTHTFYFLLLIIM